MSDKFDETLTRPVESPAGETESPDYGGASSDACEGTASDSSPSNGLKSSLNLTSQETVVKVNDFSLADIRLSQDFENTVGVKKLLTQIRVGKPPQHVFIRVRRGNEWCVEVWILEFKEDRETYLVHPRVLESVGGLAVPMILYTAITRNGDIFLLPVKLLRSDGRSDSWNESRRTAAELAMRKWIRMGANMNAGAYDIYEATGNIPEPEWPADKTLEDLLNIAFKDRIIDSHDHPVVKRLRGEI